MRFSSTVLAMTALAWLAAAPTELRAQEHEGHPAPGTALPRTPSAEGASVYIISPQNGATLSGPVTVRFGLRGMGVAPAGIPAPNTGHHHLVVDAPTPPLDAVLPSDPQHQHFGKGQTEVTLDLPKGTHTLQLVFADQNHIPHQPPLVSERISITVK
jgi:hypothetical protein